MHDLVHDLARAILAHQIDDKGNAGGDRCHYALLTDCSKPLHLSVTSPSNIKALHFVDCGKLELRGDAFSLAMCLHVLDLSECYIQKLPDSIGQLKQLKFLCAPQSRDKLIPECIPKLSELSYLNLRCSYNILALPESIGDMRGMMHLDLSGCYGICELPVSFAELKQLVHLDLSQCPVSISEAFGGFTKLQYLNLCAGFLVRLNSTGLFKVIGNLIKLRYLNLSGCMKFMAPSEDQMGSLLGPISTLLNIEHLDLSINGFSIIPESFGNLKKLHTLNISFCENIKKLPDSMVNMVSLKFLDVAGCRRLDKSAFSLSNIVLLPHFVVHASNDKSCSNIFSLQPTNPVELIIDRMENVKSAEEARSIKLIEKQKIAQLTFQWTRSAERTVDDKEVLEKLVPPISVLELSVKGYESVRLPDWLMGISQYLPNLRHIELCYFFNCNNLPSLGQLPNLRELILNYMDSLEEWNTAYTSGEEGRNEVLFPKLEKLTIINCAKLRRWSVGHYSMFPELLTLTMKYCYSLRIEPYLSGTKVVLVKCCDFVLSSAGGASSSSPVTELYVQESKVQSNLPALHTLFIKDCRDLTISPEIIKQLSSVQSLSLEEQHEAELPTWVVSLTSLQTLTLRGCRSMTSLPQCLVELTSLQSLSLIGCYRMTLLPQWFVELTSLQELKLSDCESMTSLPQSLGELASLKKLKIVRCQGIMSLPDSIQQLTKLEHLNIFHCPALVEWCESEENKMKLAHIRHKLVDKIQSSAYRGSLSSWQSTTKV